MQVPAARVIALLALAACASGSAGKPDQTAALRPVPPPMTGVKNAYEQAAATPLPKVKPIELPGLHNVFKLSCRIVSGSEPEGEKAFVELEKLGVKTILSVDGSAPNLEAASRHGMRYVHVPIQYKGLTEEQVAQITKTFRELPAPFYVHCFHGRHRGPAAAAIGRCAMDGQGRGQAIAEMRQWMGTAPEYEGLYRAVATGNIPGASETSAFAFDFSPVHKPKGLAAGMVDVGRAFDNLKDLSKRNFTADPSHPDLNALVEARKLATSLEAVHGTAEAKAAKDDFKKWLEASLTDAKALRETFTKSNGAVDATTTPATIALVNQLGKTCKACHAVYRDS